MHWHTWRVLLCLIMKEFQEFQASPKVCASLGFEVAHLVQDVPFFEWNALDTQEAKIAYLEAAIALELQNSRTHSLAA